MTDLVVFDTDCLSSFLCVSEEGLLRQLYKGRMAIPEQVEVEFRKKSKLHDKLMKLVNSGEVIVLSIEPGTAEFDLYKEYTEEITAYHAAMGWGESAATALAQVNSGTLASNNLRDIRRLVDHLALPHLTTADILVTICHEGIKNQGQLEVIWRDMRKECRMPAETFGEYLDRM